LLVNPTTVIVFAVNLGQRLPKVLTQVAKENAKTPKYCGHYRYFFLVITVTELDMQI